MNVYCAPRNGRPVTVTEEHRQVRADEIIRNNRHMSNSVKSQRNSEFLRRSDYFQVNSCVQTNTIHRVRRMLTEEIKKKD